MLTCNGQWASDDSMFHPLHMLDTLFPWSCRPEYCLLANILPKHAPSAGQTCSMAALSA